MFETCTHRELARLLETIGAACAVFEMRQGAPVLVSANLLFEEVTERRVFDCIERALSEFVPRYLEKQLRACFNSCLAKHAPDETELVVERGEACRWWRASIAPIGFAGADHARFLVTLIEITERQRLQQKLETINQRHAALVETAPDGILTVDQNQRIKMMNQAALELFGIADDNVVGWHLSRLIPERFRDRHGRYFDSFRKSPLKVRPMQMRSTVVGMRTDGSEFEAEVTIAKIEVAGNTEMAAAVRDVSDHCTMIEQLKQAATRDALTGIFNRRHGASVLSSEISRCHRFGHDLTLAMFDLDDFKEVNDRYGHACGDRVLSSVVAAVSETLRNADVFCRWGGDEFLVVLPETLLDDSMRWAERVREVLASSVATCVGGQIIGITASFGLAAYAPTDATPEELLRRADDALYRAKKGGRNQVCVGSRLSAPAGARDGPGNLSCDF